MSTSQLRNIGPKSAAWLRQVGLRSPEDLVAAGAVHAFLKVKRAGFKPSLNLLYALEGALLDCHWHDVPEPRRAQLLAELETASAALPPPRGKPVGGPVTTAFYGDSGESTDASLASESPASEDDGGNRFT
ncbi:TfoX/Sxy family protein [Pseudoxanthomonas daejeonensis]|uniref:Transcriptional regulator n=1 Tax=Pseudoxanthomonas daejeonensis TaxID=266062 RepID=A0ABQ6ZB19_9GAMM|nr:transcriptional regulator [Pseudoxanthomonas daejeonensis]